MSDQQAKNGDNERIHCNLKTRLRVLEIRLRIEKKDRKKCSLSQEVKRVKKSTNDQQCDEDCDPQQRSKLNLWSLKVKLRHQLKGL